MFAEDRRNPVGQDLAPIGQIRQQTNVIDSVDLHS
jgi:hypothetical protein